MKKDVTRRDFIKTTAVGVGATALAGLSSKEAKATQVPNWDVETDVLCVGSGGAGMAAAVAAADKGASVIVIDANDKIGGKTILAGGNLGIGGGTRQQIAKGYVENADIIYQDRTDWTLRTDKTMTVGDAEGGTHTVGQWRRISGVNDAPGLARVFADRSLDTWNWLDAMGCPFIQANVSDMSVVYRGSRYYTTTAAMNVDPEGKFRKGGAGLIRPMEAAAKKAGVQILLNHKMTKIIREGDRSGRVLGVEVRAEGKTLYFKARKGVVIGTGSWKGNKTLRLLFMPMLAKIGHVSGEPYVWNDGSGIQAALDAGASLTTDRGNDWHGWHRRPGSLWHSMGWPYGYPGVAEPAENACIYVNSYGKRFMDETVPENTPWLGGNPPFSFPQICCTQEAGPDGPIVWIILDEDQRKRQNLQFTDVNVDPNLYASGATLSELAAKIRVSAATLNETVTRYNSFVDKGEDADFGKPKEELEYKIQTPPFHALFMGIQKHNTLGGITINDKAQVLDFYGLVIPGLYAAGEAAGGMDTIGLARPILWGRVAGENAADEYHKM